MKPCPQRLPNGPKSNRPKAEPPSSNKETDMWLTFYFLVWPAISALILALLCVTLWRDIRAARHSGESMI